ncbi:hypothetical protein WICPIJ_001617 [Wickerhamomyces pijperi]|uniref:Kinetochore-associated protein MTW1 n=1 Tax=Wickerhamomyces pijperi TaxID=599730 RepID=A0A9P8QDB0_WICPI|nr:hypothetical protein WICPIJ_001617 [Wickerhamomyces pijperi]
MSAPDQKTTEILTEHLEFPPMLLIDRIINAVNDVMYKCTESVENHLLSKVGNLTEDPQSEGKKADSEIELGTTKLETLLESSIDKNFDKFELYCLRNILTIPSDLSNSFKLKHHEGLTFEKDNISKSRTLDLEIKETYTEIQLQLYIKKVLITQLNKTKRLLKLLRLYRDSLTFLNQKTSSRETINTILKNLSPLNESLYYLLQQNIEFFGKIDTINQLLKTTQQDQAVTGISVFLKRDGYLKIESIKLMKLLGLVKDKGNVEQFFANLNDVDITTVDVRSKIHERIGQQS